jgi:RNA polymerase sigma-70 factor, ECF subfamily
MPTHKLDTQTDHDLVAATRSGDTDAFGALVAKYQKRVIRVAYAITRNQEDAEDAAQTVFFKAFSRLDSFEGRSSFPTWLTSIAVNESLMLVRRRRVGVFSLDEPSDADGKSKTIDVPDPTPTPDQLCSLNESRRVLASALNRLSPNLRAALLLHLEGCSGKQTADIMGLSLAAAKARLTRAKQVLRSQVNHFLRGFTDVNARGWQ